jgi:hypothetical protein
MDNELHAGDECADAALRCLTFADLLPERDEGMGIDLRALSPGTSLAIATRNSSYRLVKLGGRGGNALIQGGSFFARETEVRVAGSTAGGSLLKIGWICLGLPLELSAGRRRFVTSPVCSITVDNPAA